MDTHLAPADVLPQSQDRPAASWRVEANPSIVAETRSPTTTDPVYIDSVPRSGICVAVVFKIFKNYFNRHNIGLMAK